MLADAELLALMATCCGRGDAVVLACFDRVSTTTGVDRERALAELQELEQAGRFRVG